MRPAPAPHALTDQYLQNADALAQDADEHAERDGAQSSAAWCLSAVLLFMSLLLLRQAFEPLSRQREAPRTAVNAGSQNRHIATVLGAPASPMHIDNVTTTVLLLPLGSAGSDPGMANEQVMREPSCFRFTIAMGAYEIPCCTWVECVQTSPADACKPSGL